MNTTREIRMLEHCRDLLRATLRHAEPIAHEDSLLAIRAAIARIEADMRAAERGQ